MTAELATGKGAPWYTPGGTVVTRGPLYACPTRFTSPTTPDTGFVIPSPLLLDIDAVNDGRGCSQRQPAWHSTVCWAYRRRRFLPSVTAPFTCRLPHRIPQFAATFIPLMLDRTVCSWFNATHTYLTPCPAHAFGRCCYQRFERRMT